MMKSLSVRRNWGMCLHQSRWVN